jgi:hypothetical protein
MSTSSGEKKESAVRTITHRMDPGHSVLYASGTRIQESFFDIRIAFGESVTEPDGSLQFIDKLTVVFSPQHAKVFLRVFADRVKNYEEKYGDINVPDKVITSIASKVPEEAKSQIQ